MVFRFFTITPKFLDVTCFFNSQFDEPLFSLNEQTYSLLIDMNLRDVAKFRLLNHHIAYSVTKEPGEVVGSLGAMQAQDYQAALWGIGLRTKEVSFPEVESAILNRAIVRIWLLRGTLHFVAAPDVRWMLDLLGPHIIAGRAGRHRQLKLDETTFMRSEVLFVEALQNGQLTRDEMFKVLEKGGISPEGQRGYHILWRAALKGLICFGPQKGKEQTFALLNQYIPKGKSLQRCEALSELARRYFSSRGPALLEDFAWWSGLKLSDAKIALEKASTDLTSETIEGKRYWMPQSTPENGKELATAFLLPAFDEYILGYSDRTATLEKPHLKKAVSNNGIFYPTIIFNGKVVGTWKRTFKKGKIVIMLSPFKTLTPTQRSSIALTAKHYSRFMEMPVSITK